jgi:hypothetical protein
MIHHASACGSQVMTNGDVFVPIVWPNARTATPTALTTTVTAAAIASRRRSERDTVATLCHPGRVRRLAALALVSLTLAGCGSATVQELAPAAGPAHAPQLTQAPAGRVLDTGAAPGPTTATVATTDDGHLQAVLAPQARRLALYDSRTHERVDAAPAGVGPTHVIGFGDRLYVADTQGEALLIYHVRPRLTLTRRVYLPGAPYGLALDPVRRRLWVTLTARNELVGLTADRTAPEVARLPTVRQPDAVSVDSASGTVTVTGGADGALQRIGADEAYGQERG